MRKDQVEIALSVLEGKLDKQSSVITAALRAAGDPEDVDADFVADFVARVLKDVEPALVRSIPRNMKVKSILDKTEVENGSDTESYNGVHHFYWWYTIAYPTRVLVGSALKFDMGKCWDAHTTAKFSPGVLYYFVALVTRYVQGWGSDQIRAYGNVSEEFSDKLIDLLESNMDITATASTQDVTDEGETELPESEDPVPHWHVNLKTAPKVTKTAVDVAARTVSLWFTMEVAIDLFKVTKGLER